MHRFEKLTEVAGLFWGDPSMDDKCWVWPHSCNPKTGYGQFTAERKLWTAHRVSYEYFRAGGLPVGAHVLHKCDNRPCFNPRHLFLGTAQTNSDDKIAKGRAKTGVSLGERHGRAKATNEIVLAIRASGESLEVLAERHGLSRSAVHAIRARKSWAHVADPVHQQLMPE